jgi:hypothetical protein
MSDQEIEAKIKAFEEIIANDTTPVLTEGALIGAFIRAIDPNHEPPTSQPQ